MKRINKKWDNKKITSQIAELLNNYDDGELFVEEVFSENISYDDNKIKNASFDQDRGFGIRTVLGDSSNFFHSSNLQRFRVFCDDIKC